MNSVCVCVATRVRRVGSVTQVVLETVAGLVGVGEAGVKRSCPVVLDLLVHVLRHLQLVDNLQRTNSM